MFQLKQGTTRNVLKVGRWALKFPRLNHWGMFLEGLLANRSEQRFNRWLRPWVVEIIWYVPGGWLNVTRWAQPVDDEVAKQFLGLLVQGSDIPKLRYLRDVIENKTDSYGQIGNSVVVLDYAE